LSVSRFARLRIPDSSHRCFRCAPDGCESTSSPGRRLPIDPSRSTAPSSCGEPGSSFLCSSGPSRTLPSHRCNLSLPAAVTRICGDKPRARPHEGSKPRLAGRCSRTRRAFNADRWKGGRHVDHHHPHHHHLGAAGAVPIQASCLGNRSDRIDPRLRVIPAATVRFAWERPAHQGPSGGRFTTARSR
jgi:hypothetical protein